MPKLSKLLSIAFTTLILSSCATQSQRIALTESNKKHIQSNHIFVNKAPSSTADKQGTLSHSERPDPLAPMGGMTSAHNNARSEHGLIGNLIIKSLESQNEFDSPNHLNHQLTKSILKFPWLNVKKYHAKYNINGKEFSTVTKDHENTTLFIETKYAFNSTFSQLKVTAYVKLVQISVGNNAEVVLYKNNFYVINQLREPDHTGTNKISWTKNKGALLTKKLKAAGSELARMITMDMQNPATQIYSPNSKQIAFRDFSGYRNVGHLIKKDRSYYIIAGSNQELYAANPGDIME